MDVHHGLELGQRENMNEDILEPDSCVLDSQKNCIAAADSKDDGYRNGVGIDINRENIINGIFGGEENEPEVFENKVELSGTPAGKEILSNFRNEATQDECFAVVVAPSATVNWESEGDKDAMNEGTRNIDPPFVMHEKNLLSIDGASMSANVFGPPGFGSQKNCNKNQYVEGIYDETFLLERKLSSPNGDRDSEGQTITLDATTNGPSVVDVNQDEIFGEQVQNEDRNFVVGDIVWVKTLTKLWWPGIISDPSKASYVPTVSNRKHNILVKQFANPCSVWTSSSQLKEFTCCFEELATQNKSGNFLGAMGRAIDEIGSRVREEMSCSCFQKESQHSHPLSSGQVSDGAPESIPKSGVLRSFPLSQFQPETFLALIKYLAVDTAVPKKIQVTITQNCLSAFYCYIGHHQMPMHQLRPNNPKDRVRSSLTPGGKNEVFCNDVSKAGKFEDNHDGHETMASCHGKFDEVEQKYQLRDKKRRKLSSPLTNKTEDLNNASNQGMESGVTHSEGSKVLQEGSRKSIFGNSVNTVAKFINSPSDKMLYDLCGTAINGSHCKDGRHLKRFFSCFRRFAFLKVEDASLEMLTEFEQPTEGTKRPTKKSASKKPQGDASSSCKSKKNKQKKTNIKSKGKDSHGMSKELVNASAVSEDQVDSNAKESKKLVRKRKKSNVDSESKDSSCMMKNVMNGSIVSEGCIVSDVTGSKKIVRKREKANVKGVKESLCTVKNETHGTAVIEGHAGSKGTKIKNIVRNIQNDAAASGICDTKTANALPDLNATAASLSVEGFQFTGCATAASEYEGKMREMENMSRNNGSLTFMQLLNDVQGRDSYLFQSVARENNVGAQSNFASESFAKQSEAKQIDFASLARQSQMGQFNYASGSFGGQAEANATQAEIGVHMKNFQPEVPQFPPGAILEPKKRKRKPKEKPSKPLINDFTPRIPDLNNNIAEPSSGRDTVLASNSNKPKDKPPRKRKSKSSATASETIKSGNTLQARDPFSRMNGFKAVSLPPGISPHLSQPPDVMFIKQKLEMMKATLQKTGDTLSPQVRAKLEDEINGFSVKVSSMFGSSSS